MTVMAEAALDAGMDEICFTDHVEPLTWGSNELRPPYDWSALTEDFANVQAALGDRIHLRLGMEMGDAQKAPAHMKKLLEDAPQFDFIIGSVHLLSERFGSEDLYLYTPKDQAEAQTALGDYLEEVLALAKLGGFTVLGHLTLPLRYFNEMRGLHTSFDPYEAEIREILKTLIENGRGIELNANRGNTPLPDAKWLRMYRELGGELITLGTDAHAPDAVGRAIREGQALAAGVRLCPVLHLLAGRAGLARTVIKICIFAGKAAVIKAIPLPSPSNGWENLERRSTHENRIWAVTTAATS